MDAYIIATSRTPIGRAFKGALKDERPEDLAAHAIRSLLAKVPQIEASEIAETILGIGVPGGQQGSNLARVVNVMIGLDSVPAHVVSRFCASSAQAIRSAANSIAAGEGHCYIAAGVESISSFLQTDVDNLPGSKSPHFDAAQLNTLANAANLKPWQDPRILGQLPDVMLRWDRPLRTSLAHWGLPAKTKTHLPFAAKNLRRPQWQTASFSVRLHLIDWQMGMSLQPTRAFVVEARWRDLRICSQYFERVDP